MKVVWYGLYLMCLCPTKTRHVSMILWGHNYELISLALFKDDHSRWLWTSPLAPFYSKSDPKFKWHVLSSNMVGVVHGHLEDHLVFASWWHFDREKRRDVWYIMNIGTKWRLNFSLGTNASCRGEKAWQSVKRLLILVLFPKKAIFWVLDQSWGA